MTIEFVDAVRSASKARIALCGPSGSGKTYTALTLATRLSDNVAVIDTERGRAQLYVGINGWKFKTFVPQTFAPAALTEALAVADAAGIGCIVVDSLTHYWSGVDGMLEQVDKKGKSGGNFGGWKEMRPDERRMIDALAQFSGHVIVTMRVKTEYVVEDNANGKKAPRKIGLKPDQREGIDYEFDVVADLDPDNTLSVSKTRIPSLAQAVISKPGPELADQILSFLEEGDTLPTASEYQNQAQVCETREELLKLYTEVKAASMAGAPVLGIAGEPTVLGDYIVAVGQAMTKPVVAAVADVPATKAGTDATAKLITQIKTLSQALKLDPAAVAQHFKAKHGKDLKAGTEAELMTFRAELQKNGIPAPVSPVRAAA
jgi:hypothetical protein